MKFKSPTLIALVIVSFTACNETAVDQNAAAEELMNLSREWAQTAIDRDIEKVVTYWAEDAIIMSPNEPAVRGREAINAMVNESLNIPGFEIKWEPQEAYVSKSGDLGYVIIKNYVKIPIDSLGNVTTLYHKGVEIWKKEEDGSWKNAVDIYNGDPSIKSID